MYLFGYDFRYIINISVSIIMYILGFLIIWWLFSDSIMTFLKNRTQPKRFRKNQKEAVSSNGLVRHIQVLIDLSSKNRKSNHVKNSSAYTFFVLTGSIFVVMLLILSRQSSIIFSGVTSLLFALLPYGFLWSKLISMRVEASFEGESLVSELLNQYKINYLNMSEAIDRSIVFLNNTPNVQFLLTRLAYQLKECASDDELIVVLKEFTFGIDTEWSKMLSNNLYLALIDGMDVTIGLDDILKELRQAKSSHEANARINSEGFAIVQLMSPIMYLGSIYVAVKYFDFTVLKFFNYQLFTATGIKFTMAMLGLFIANIGIIVAFKNQKFDF